MSWQATAYVKSLTISSTGQQINRGEKLILLLLADYTDPHTCTAWPSMDSLANDGLYSRRQVIRILEVLEKKGFIETVHSGGRTVNHYKIVGLATVSKCHSVKSATVTFPTSNSDILSTNSDIVMSQEPQEPIQQPQLITISEPNLFDECWKIYPKSVAKPKAKKAYAQALKRIPEGESSDFIYKRMVLYAAACNGKDKQFIPHISTWLNQDRFTDDPKDWVEINGNRQATKAERRNARISETTRRVFDPARHIPGYNSKGLPDGTT